MVRAALLLLLVPGLLAPGALAVSAEYSDEASFVAATGATEHVTYPVPCALCVTYTENGVTMNQPGGEALVIDEWTALFPGLDLAISGPEHLRIQLGAPTHAFGIHLTDNFDGPNANGVPMDSAWVVDIYDGLALVESLFIDPALDAASFLGIARDTPFDEVRFTEWNWETQTQCPPTGVPCNENDFFGRVLLSRDPATPPVPELGTLALAAAGLVGVASFVALRRR